MERSDGCSQPWFPMWLDSGGLSGDDQRRGSGQLRDDAQTSPPTPLWATGHTYYRSLYYHKFQRMRPRLEIDQDRLRNEGTEAANECIGEEQQVLQDIEPVVSSKGISLCMGRRR